MKMLAVYHEDLYVPIFVWDGVLGLSPTPINNSDSFVLMMKQQGIIDIASFGVFYEDTKYGSKITFGGIDTDIVPNFDNLTFTKLYDNQSWSVNITSMKYGKITLHKGSIKGVIDTGKSMIMLPPEQYLGYVKEAHKSKTCYTTSPILR